MGASQEFSASAAASWSVPEVETEEEEDGIKDEED